MTKDLTSGSPLKVILMFTFPLVLGYLFQQFYALVMWPTPLGSALRPAWC